MTESPRSRRSFTPEEDARLIRLIAEHGTSNWALIAKAMGDRFARQCRERWKSSLSPGHTNPAWTEAEDRRLFELYAIHGPRWARITTFFPGRSDYNVKNRWKRCTRIGPGREAGQTEPLAVPPVPNFDGKNESDFETFDLFPNAPTWSFDDK
jgi:hypothetical protein